MYLLTLILILCAAPLAAVEQQPVDLPGGHVLHVPSDWGAEGGRGMRAAQFGISGAEDQRAEFIVFYFGPDGAGSVADNLVRWQEQFQAEGRVVEQDEGEGQHGRWNLLQVTGTWNKPIGPPMAGRSEAAPGSAMLAAVLPGPAGPYYLKLTGPRQLVLDQRSAFEQMLLPR